LLLFREIAIGDLLNFLRKIGEHFALFTTQDKWLDEAREQRFFLWILLLLDGIYEHLAKERIGRHIVRQDEIKESLELAEAIFNRRAGQAEPHTATKRAQSPMRLGRRVFSDLD